MITINIANDFTETPGTRFAKDGPNSGEEFREKILVPVYERAAGAQIRIELDGAEGYPASFLEEAFGGFARTYGKSVAESVFVFITEDHTLVREIKEYIANAN
jgi:hypothetical protein